MIRCKSKRVVSTTFSSELLNKLAKPDTLEITLTGGPSKRLKEYRADLAKSRGLDQPMFDDQVKDLLLQYARSDSQVKEEIDYLNQLICEDGHKFSRNLKIYETIESQMIRFSDKDHSDFSWNENFKKALKRLDARFRSMSARPISYCSDDDIRNALPKEGTHSGWTYIMSGFKKKGDNLEGIYKRFELEKDEALKKGTFDKPILIGFRTQGSGEYEDDGSRTNSGKHKTRVVSMIDLMVIIAELKFSKPVQNFMSQYDFYAGGKTPDQISSAISNWRSKNQYFLSIDYSAFDQTISSWLIKSVFEVLRKHFKLSEEDNALWNVMVHDFIHKRFVLNEGILTSHKGVPSGSMWTQIIDTLVNLVVVDTYFESIGKKASMIAMGDDNAIFTNANVELEHMASYIKHNFGLVVKTDDKSNCGSCAQQDIKFLSRYWRWHGQWRHPNQLISRMLFPERFRKYSKEVTPAHVMYAYILTYPLGMSQLIDVGQFLRDHPISKEDIYKRVDSRYLPGALAYIREYTQVA